MPTFVRPSFGLLGDDLAHVEARDREGIAGRLHRDMGGVVRKDEEVRNGGINGR